MRIFLYSSHFMNTKSVEQNIEWYSLKNSKSAISIPVLGRDVKFNWDVTCSEAEFIRWKKNAQKLQDQQKHWQGKPSIFLL